MAKKSFNEKLRHNSDLPKVEAIIDPRQAARLKTDTLLIAAPLQYDQLMKRVPEGLLITIDRIMVYLARKHQAGATCPMTAGIFTNIAAHASEERLGLDETPWWRTLKKGGELSEKFPGGLEGHKIRLEAEGHSVIQRGKRFFVENYEEKLYALE